MNALSIDSRGVILKVLVTSEQDIASLTIHDVLVKEYKFIETNEMFENHPILRKGNILLITTIRDMIHCNHLEGYFDAEVFIFCSRHRAASGRPALLVHSTGNFSDEAEYGGSPYELSISTGSLVAAALRKLAAEKSERGLDEFDLSLEVTHHGPSSMDTALLFVELGSDEKYWRHMEGARAVAAAVMECANAQFDEDAYIGFGGPHYARKFTSLILEKNLRISHIAPKYVLDVITEKIVKQMVFRSQESVKKAIIDWKGTNANQKEILLPILDKIGIDYVRAKQL
jgi:D-aminoacyl-tRNA deacylase